MLDLAASLHQPGEVGEVFADDQGLFLVRLIERRPAHVRSFETVRAGLERRLLAERRRALEEEFNAAIRQQARVETFTNRLTALEGLAGNEPPDAGGSPLQFTSR